MLVPKIEIDFSKWYEKPRETRAVLSSKYFMEIRDYKLMISGWLVCNTHIKSAPITEIDRNFIEKILKEIEDHESRN